MTRRKLVPVIALALTLMTGSSACAAGPGAPATIVPARLATQATVYVANFLSGTVTPIRMATGTAGKAIKVARGPECIALTPNGQIAYVARLPGHGHSDTDRHKRRGPGNQVGRHPTAIAITPDGKTAYVVNSGSDTVTPIRIATGIPAAHCRQGRPGPGPIAITPDGKTAYVANGDAGTVTPILTATNSPGQAITVGNGPIWIAITPNSKTAYVANQDSQYVSEISTATNAVVKQYPSASRPTPSRSAQGGRSLTWSTPAQVP